MLKRLPGSNEALRHCLRLSSSYAPLIGRHGRHEEARAYCDKAFELSPLEPLRVIWHFVRAEASLAVSDPQSALDEAQRGMAVNPSHGQLFLVGAVASWRLDALAQAREWVATLRQHAAFCSPIAVRTTLERTFDPAAIGQLEQLLDTLREAGLPQK